MIVDLMYFGYEHEENSAKFERDFIEEVTSRFPDVVLEDAYDDIKGYRQKVSLDKNLRDDYMSWLIGKGWLNLSFNMNMIMIDVEQVEEFNRLFDLAKVQYPESFIEE